MGSKWASVLVAVVMGSVGAAIAMGVSVVRSASERHCIGADDYFALPDSSQARFRLDTRNVVIGAVLVETVIAPIYIALEAAFCPEAADGR